MKIKVQPSDFIVEEITTIPKMRHGPYTLVKLTKQYWNTLDAINLLARSRSIPRQNISRAGLKDRYSRSVQYLTIKGRFTHALETVNVQAVPIGYTSEPMSPAFLRCNRFTITLRDCSTQEVSRITKNIVCVRNHGIINYFDEQRFGSARHKKGFFAKLLARTHYNGALKLLLCYPHKNEKKAERTFKQYCMEHWGHWKDCYRIAPPTYQKIMGTLVQHPRDYRRAIKTIDRELLNLYILAYQSYLFNEIVREYIEHLDTNLIRISYTMGTFVFFKNKIPGNRLADMQLPLLNEKSVLDDRIKPIVQTILNQEGITLKDLALRKMRFRGVRFKSPMRDVVILPDITEIGNPENDDRYAPHKKFTLSFDLPPGSYATLLIKRLMA